MMDGARGKKMREILFRGKRCDNGEWVQGYYSERKDTKGNIIESVIIEDAYEQITNGQRYMRSNLNRECFRVDPETVGQFTGLTDKNGTKIFEGDIVDILTENEEIGVVVYDDGGFQVDADGFCVDFHSNIYGTDLEVIGNIHDNPELLEVNVDG